MNFLTFMAIALIVSSIGFYKYVYFISLGYGFSIAAFGVVMPLLFKEELSMGTISASILFLIYGLRLGGYLLVRERKSASYNAAMKKEIKDGSAMKFGVKACIWISCSLLYVLQVSPVLFRLENMAGTDMVCIIGITIMTCGIIIESLSDWQKSKAKAKNPSRFCDSGLFKMVRCPNYFGEVVFWTGVFVSGINVIHGVFQWTAAIVGYVCIVYIMFGGARRLELRQNRNYGNDPEYREYVKKTPILLPLVPLYSVEKYKWLVG